MYSWLSNCQRRTAGKYQSQMETKSDCISCSFRISWENAMRHSLENRMLGFPSSLCETVSKESLRLHESIFREIMKWLTKYKREEHRNGLTLKVLAHRVCKDAIFASIFLFSRIRRPFLSKCMLWNAKTQKIELDQNWFYDRRKLRRQCVNVIDTMWGRIYFLLLHFA